MSLILLSIPIILTPLYTEGLIFILKKYFRADLTEEEKKLIYEPVINIYKRELQFKPWCKLCANISALSKFWKLR